MKRSGVQTGTGALEILSSKLVGAVLLDLLMPGMDGFQVIRHIREIESLRDLPIFVMTGKNLSSEEIALVSRDTQALFPKNGHWQQQLIAEIALVLKCGNQAKAAGQKMKNILIAEDNAVNRELLRELLKMRGYAVTEACDGQEALLKIVETEPDVLLLDLGMPVLDGFGTIQAIRENPSLKSLPVLAVTAYAMRGDRERILDSGFDGYLSKPINPTALDEELQRFLNRDSPHQCSRKNGVTRRIPKSSK